jgi:hypothetical protein
MTFQEAAHILRSGEGRIMPVVEWFAEEEDPISLLPMLFEEGTRKSVLYVLSELPPKRVSEPIREVVQSILPRTAKGSQERGWAMEVLSPDEDDVAP